MAKFEINGLEDMGGSMERLQAIHERSAVRRIVMAGADADTGLLSEITRRAGHVRTGSMMESIRAGDYHETIGGGEVNVYPQGEDAKGDSNTIKAFVINYGRGKRKRRGKMGDKFITSEFQTTAARTSAAMQAEAEKILKEAGIT